MSQSTDSVNIPELSRRGYQLLRESAIHQAIEIFEQIISEDPQNNYALVGIGDALRKDRQFDRAMKYYQDCLQYHADNHYALFGLADCCRARRQYREAIDVWEQYLQHDGKNTTVLTRVADAYRKIKKYPESKDMYLRVLDIDEENTFALIGLGHLCYDYKEYENAARYWKIVIRTSGERVDIRVLTSVGNCFRKLKQFREALPYFERALNAQSDNFYALFGIADCYRGLSQPDQSLVYWDRILKNDPLNKVIITRAGDAYRSLNKPDMAAAFYQKALDIEFDIYAALGLALIAKSEGKYESALKQINQLIQKEPHNHRLYIEAAECYKKIGDFQMALATIHQFQDQDQKRIAEYRRDLEQEISGGKDG